MRKINLDPIPNQSVSVRLDNSLYDITIKETNGVMSASIARDNVQLIQGYRIVAGQWIIPFKYLEKGNFIITSENEEIPYYTNFGITQSLLYVSQLELDAIRART